MNLNTILSFFAPKDRKFHTLFMQDAENMQTTAKALKTLFNNPNREQWKMQIAEVERLEHVGDEITHRIFKELSQNFITPFDREDIHYLTTTMDDVVDYMQTSAQRLELTKIKVITEPMKQLVDLIEASVTEIHTAVGLLKEKDYGKMSEVLVRVHSIENQADDIFDASISDLFENETNAIELLKCQQMIDMLETTTDKCEDVANAIESIVLKYA